MKKIELEIPDGKTLECVDGTYRLVDEKPKDICDRIKTFEDACDYINELDSTKRIKGKFGYMLLDYKDCLCHTKDMAAYMKLRIICAALNEGETLNNSHDWYYPYFSGFRFGGGAIDGSAAGFVCSGSKRASAAAYAYLGSRLCLADERRSNYCGKQFEQLWKDYYFG